MLRLTLRPIIIFGMSQGAGATMGQMHHSSATFQFTKFFKTEVAFTDWSDDSSTVDRSWWMIFTLDY
ncbi:MAG: hypothetical protein NT033_00985 [Candidatus Omnitrophica bacterium]|nr:hypothetical protein [Candidatus Omnitrophota bacterium]